jgi:hypothetical protein
MVVTRKRALWKDRRGDLHGNACCVAARPPPRFENAFTSDQAMVSAALSLERDDASRMSGVRRLSSLALSLSTSRLKGPATTIAARASCFREEGRRRYVLDDDPWSVERTTPQPWPSSSGARLALQIADIETVHNDPRNKGVCEGLRQ